MSLAISRLLNLPRWLRLDGERRRQNEYGHNEAECGQAVHGSASIFLTRSTSDAGIRLNSGLTV